MHPIGRPALHNPSSSPLSGTYSPRLSISLPAGTSAKDLYAGCNNNDVAIPVEQDTRRNSARDHQSLHPSEEEETTAGSRSKCSDRTKKCIKGVILTLLIAFSWVGTLHLLKLTFHWNQMHHQQQRHVSHNPTIGPVADSPFASQPSPDSHVTLSLSTLSSLSPATIDPPHILPESTDHRDDVDGDEPFNASTSASVPAQTELSGSRSSPSSPSLSSSPPSSSASSQEEVGEQQEKQKESNVMFNAPFFMAWYCSIWNVLFLPIFLLIKALPCCFEREKSSSRNLLIDSLQHLMSQRMTISKFVGRCTFFCLLWLMTTYLLIFTIRRLDVTVVMALLACSVTLVYLLSWVVLHHQFVGMRIVAVIICDTGIALLAYMDGTSSRTIGPVVLAAAAAVSSSIYKVFYHRMIGYATYGEMSLFFTLIGVLNLCLLWPVVLLLYAFGIETLVWSQIPWLPLSGAAALSLAANLMAYLGLYWTYEVFLSSGLVLAIPISSVIDAWAYNVVFKQMKMFGILLIILGFAVVILPDNWNQFLAKVMRTQLSKWRTAEGLKKNGTRVQDTTTAQLSRLRTPSGRVK